MTQIWKADKMFIMIVYVFCAVLFSWLVVLTWMLIKIRNHYNRLIIRTRKNTIDEVLDGLLNENNINQSEIQTLKKQTRELFEKEKSHFQKIGLIRFNPFDRMGGEQSFVLSLLDENSNGVTINFIHTREGLRVYSKKIKNGRGEGYELSEEERKAIEKSS